MKKFLCVLLCVMLVFSLAACSSNKAADTEETVAEVSQDAASSEASVTEEDAPVRPDNYGTVKLGEYKGLDVTVEKPEVTDEEVQTEIDNALANYPMDVTGRAVADGDILNIDYEGKLDGVAFDGGTAQGASLTIGSHTFIDGFEDGLKGAEIGETRDLNLKFPDEYWNEELAGKEVVFTVTVNGIQAPQDELTDEWVESYTAGEYKKVDDFKAALRKDLEEFAQENAVENAKSVLLQDIIDNSEFTTEQAAVDYEFDRLMESYESYIVQYTGISLSDYMESVGMDMETLETELKSYAETAVKQQLIVNEIFDKEGMKIEEADEQRVADMYGVTIDDLKSVYDEDTYESNVKTTKVLQYIFDNAVQK